MTTVTPESNPPSPYQLGYAAYPGIHNPYAPGVRRGDWNAGWLDKRAGRLFNSDVSPHYFVGVLPA